MDTGVTKRRDFSDKFMAAVALEALRGYKTINEVAARRQRHPTQMSTLKRRAIEALTAAWI
jgi:transposase